MLIGNRSWLFENRPVITSTGVVGGPFEKKGKLTADFHSFSDDLWFGEDSYEKAQKKFLEEACHEALNQGNLQKEDIQFIFAGDLLNQITSTSFACRSLSIPYFGLFGACSTSMEALALAAFVVNGKGANNVITGSASHNAAVEKTFRYPTEYGSQKPPTSQWTVTAAGVGVVSSSGTGPVVTSATVGKVIDEGLKDPYNMGGAMAPAAVDTIKAHFEDRSLPEDYYDLILTGDLGKIGHAVALELFQNENMQIDQNSFQDAGLMIYNDEQPVQSGASGAGCSAAVTYGHIYNRLKQGELNKVLIVATGALLSPLTFQQQESIPCIAHAVSIERQGGFVQ
ncbi:stage V sporulation protein AD [Salipaludibacillus agaradhaerens]|uniref:Stage V sporulation protein AD n=1 Tax=Salipaludibacillus agaradhaerens TaxID=76935 RepID=A0A9Q4FZ95_SALAG|nr:stage V sporulation protein AD [Salipaludibacillus agaradhaerens]MCR6096573.1 stage V sporulation protein AD [Salipaludibacillus agaradhaerens]MCR6113868.1 stage V sporulation protein AD [Salipaludibacillus agaradhaerens]